MAETTSAAALAAPLPTSDEIDRAAAFVREPFVLEGEDAQSALASGTPRRRALDAALAEIAAGHDSPSVEWRRDWSIMLGLERVLSEDEPKLVDGTVLSAHQVDALSGTLTALLAQAIGNGNGPAHGAPPPRGRGRAPPRGHPGGGGRGGRRRARRADGLGRAP